MRRHGQCHGAAWQRPAAGKNAQPRAACTPTSTEPRHAPSQPLALHDAPWAPAHARQQPQEHEGSVVLSVRRASKVAREERTSAAVQAELDGRRRGEDRRRHLEEGPTTPPWGPWRTCSRFPSLLRCLPNSSYPCGSRASRSSASMLCLGGLSACSTALRQPAAPRHAQFAPAPRCRRQARAVETRANVRGALCKGICARCSSATRRYGSVPAA